ncbi:23S rRNA (guanosine(2251)-2'-O)-methyltransferase RlmB [Synechococcus sp. NOUM97013]|uniref:23S rRNA (guanosine(2251)-2'-O)-methyltransferase RlmB n=1 Tax=Synechococcus sp. NOUM97013 TaxID=1442555 RepID=UPI001647EECB|nr:23S rRNA (guanosine(2251)-2'-O)-methyltransferase RlmB [Synechococcus sp. NOUM97013]QNI73278.1 23S rRNA (guanosine2251-2'-O)-methyltransferase [Synechococcus sp. NOUM97013]
MSSRFDRRPPRPSRGGDSGGGRPSRGGPRGRRPRPEGGSSYGRRRDGEDGGGESSWRGSRDGGEFRGRPASRGGSFRGSSRDSGRPMVRGDRRERRFDERSGGDRRFESRRFDERRSDDRRSDERRFDDRRSGDRRSGDRRFDERRSEDRRFGDRRPGGRRFSDGEGRVMRSGRSERADQRFDEQPRGEASAHGSEGVADDLLWGRHATQAALEAGRPIHRIWCTSEMRSAPKFMALLRDAKASGVLVEEVTWARLAQMTGGAVHQGIALQTAAADTLNLEDLVEGCAALQEAPLLLALDGLTDPHNLGAIVRSAEALGAHGVVLPQRRSAGLTGSVAKVAAGALEHLPVARVVNLNRSLETLKDAGYRVIGLAEEGDQTLEEVDLDGPLVVVTGSEGQGLSMLTRRHCDQLIRIPLRGVTPSLNASVATALCLYEVARRGWMKGLSGQNPSPPIVRPQLSVAHLQSPEAPEAKADDAQTQPEVADPDPGVDLQMERPAEAVSTTFDGSIDL